MKGLRLLHLRRMPEVRKFDELCIGDGFFREPRKLRIMAKARAHVGGRQILADRSRILSPISSRTGGFKRPSS
jgi:hypothetical protein